MDSWLMAIWFRFFLPLNQCNCVHRTAWYFIRSSERSTLKLLLLLTNSKRSHFHCHRCQNVSGVWRRERDTKKDTNFSTCWTKERTVLTVKSTLHQQLPSLSLSFSLLWIDGRREERERRHIEYKESYYSRLLHELIYSHRVAIKNGTRTYTRRDIHTVRGWNEKNYFTIWTVLTW